MATKMFFIEYYKPAHQPHGLVQFLSHVPRSLSVAEARVLLAELTEVLSQHPEGAPDHQKGAARPALVATATEAKPLTTETKSEKESTTEAEAEKPTETASKESK